MQTPAVFASSSQAAHGRGTNPRSDTSSSSSSVGSGSDSDSDDAEQQVVLRAAGAQPLSLHAREVVLLRLHKPPVRVVAPVPKAMRSVLQSSGLM